MSEECPAASSRGLADHDRSAAAPGSLYARRARRASARPRDRRSGPFCSIPDMAGPPTRSRSPNTRPSPPLVRRRLPTPPLPAVPLKPPLPALPWPPRPLLAFLQNGPKAPSGTGWAHSAPCRLRDRQPQCVTVGGMPAPDTRTPPNSAGAIFSVYALKVTPVHQRVETAIFVVAGLTRAALIPRRSWLLAALYTPQEPRSCLAPFQGRYHNREAGSKALILRLQHPGCCTRASSAASTPC